jgi:hypothetical protein
MNRTAQTAPAMFGGQLGQVIDVVLSDKRDLRDRS